MSGKLQGHGAVTEGVVAEYVCGYRSPAKLTLVGGIGKYLVPSCPGDDVIRAGDVVRLVSVIGLYGDQNVLRLENLSRRAVE